MNFFFSAWNENSTIIKENVLKMSYIELSTFNLVYTIFHVCLHPPAFITQGHIDRTLVGNFEKAYRCYTGHSSIYMI